APRDSGHSPADWRSSARRPPLPGDSSRRALVSPTSDGANARIVRPAVRRACAVPPPGGAKPLHWRRMDSADVIVVGAGVVGLAEARALEPQLACAAALHSPLSGILDAHAYMQALLAEAESRGATLVCGSAVTRLVLGGEAVLIGVNGAEPALRARTLVNC